jgi:putative transposase
MRKSFKYRLYPTRKQAERLQHTLDLCRELYNAALEERRVAWRDHGIRVNYFSQSAQLPELKEARPDLVEVYSQVLQDVLRRVEKTFQAFFRRCRDGERPGYPRFKGYNRYDSFTYPQYPSGASLRDNRLYLSKIGGIKVKLHRAVEGTVKTVTIKREAGKWYAIFSCENVPAKPLPKTGQAVGIDVGLESFATLSDGTQIQNPRWYQRAQRRLKVSQRTVSRRKRGSQRWTKAVRALQVAHAKVRNQRLDFHHKLAHGLVSKYDLIAFEALNIKGMVRNHHLAKSLSDAGWGQFLRILAFKAEEAGKQAIAVNPRLTSQRCSRCGTIVQKGLSQRWHLCHVCGLSLHRDHNSALEILRLGRSLQRGARDITPAPMTWESDCLSCQSRHEGMHWAERKAEADRVHA